MTRLPANRRTAGIIAAALAFGISVPLAQARPNAVGSAGSPAASHPAPAPAARLSTAHPAGGIPDWGYVAIGSGVASLVVIGAGGTRVVSRRRRREPAAVQPRVAG